MVSLGPNAQWTRGATPEGDNKQWEILKIWDTTLVKIVRMTLTWLYTEKRENKKNKKFFMAVLCEFSSYPHLLNDIIIHRTELINNALLFKVLLNYVFNCLTLKDQWMRSSTCALTDLDTLAFSFKHILELTLLSIMNNYEWFFLEYFKSVDSCNLEK